MSEKKDTGKGDGNTTKITDAWFRDTMVPKFNAFLSGLETDLVIQEMYEFGGQPTAGGKQ